MLSYKIKFDTDTISYYVVDENDKTLVANFKTRREAEYYAEILITSPNIPYTVWRTTDGCRFRVIEPVTQKDASGIAANDPSAFLTPNDRVLRDGSIYEIAPTREYQMAEQQVVYEYFLDFMEERNQSGMELTEEDLLEVFRAARNDTKYFQED